MDNNEVLEEIVEAEPEYEYENSYEITEAIYLDWASHPVGTLAKKRSRAMIGMTIVEIMISLGLAVVGLIRSEWLYVIVGGLCSVYFVINVTLLRSIRSKQEFRQLRRKHHTEHWLRVMRFGEQITVDDAGDKVTFEWVRVTEVTQDAAWVLLWLNQSSAYRVKKDSFTKGDADGFFAFAKGKTRK